MQHNWKGWRGAGQYGPQKPFPAQAVVDDQGQRPQQPQVLWKTRMCKFNITQSCVKGAACQYAHDMCELRTKPDLSKTSLCRQFAVHGTCTRPNCSFAHGRHELRCTDAFYKTKMCCYHKTGQCQLGIDCRYAHSPSELRKEPVDDADNIPRAISEWNSQFAIADGDTAEGTSVADAADDGSTPRASDSSRGYPDYSSHATPGPRSVDSDETQPSTHLDYSSKQNSDRQAQSPDLRSGPTSPVGGSQRNQRAGPTSPGQQQQSPQMQPCGVISVNGQQYYAFPMQVPGAFPLSICGSPPWMNGAQSGPSSPAFGASMPPYFLPQRADGGNDTCHTASVEELLAAAMPQAYED